MQKLILISLSKKLFTEIKPANVNIESSKDKLMKLLSKTNKI